MKRFYLVILAVIMLPQIAVAQHYFYHNVGDTIRGRDTIYYYQWWNDNWIHGDEDSASQVNILGAPNNAELCGGEMLQHFYTPQPLTIIGIAGCAAAACHFLPYDSQYVDSTDLAEYFTLYDATSDSLILKKSVRWNMSDPHRILQLETHDVRSSIGCDLVYDTFYRMIFECYFEDKPITVTDSFYLGVSFHSYIVSFVEGAVDHAYRPDYVGLSKAPLIYNSTCEQIPYQHFIFLPERSDGIYQAGVPFYFSDQSIYALFPIVQIDTSYAYPDTVPYVCPEVDNFRLADASGENAVLMWNSNSEHQSWQISIAAPGEDIDDGILDTVITNTFFMKTGLDSCLEYRAYIRALCNHRDSIYYSEWSDSVILYSCDTTGSGTGTEEGIDTADGESGTYLMPNPAKDRVTVMSHSIINSVEVYSLSGSKLLATFANSHSAELDTSSLPVGQYIVTIKTANGIFTRKLIIE